MTTRLFMSARAAGFASGTLVLAGFLLLLGWQIATHVPMTAAGAPYEGWDEVVTYNGSRVLSGPAAGAAYRYGSLDSFIQIVANEYFRMFDVIGPQYRHISYSNNDYASLNDEFYAYGLDHPGELGYNYFRGIDDRRPISLSRELHFYLFYGLVAAAGMLWVAVLGGEAVWLILPMLCLTVNREVYEQAANALPNGINVILSFAIVASIGLALETRRDRLLHLAAIGLALAMNFKVDVAPLGAILGLALIWRGRELGIRRTVRLGLTALGAFLAVLVATKPELLIAPDPLPWLFPPVAPANEATRLNFFGKSLELLRSLKAELLPDAWQYYVPVAATPVALLTGAAAVVVALRRDAAALCRLIVPALGVSLLWLIPVALVSIYYGRYALNGLGAFYALVGLALLSLRRYGALPGRRLALVLAAILAGQYALMIADGTAKAAYVASRSNFVVYGEGNSGYSVEQTRNIVEWHAVEAARAGGYDRTVLVDQHAYLDLRMLRLAGLDPVYVNIDTIDTVLSRLDRSVPHLLIFSPGTADTDPSWWEPWMYRWPAALKQRYDAYLARLSRFPVLADTGGPPQRLLWTGPVDHLDRMVLAAVPPGEGKRASE